MIGFLSPPKQSLKSLRTIGEVYISDDVIRWRLVFLGHIMVMEFHCSTSLLCRGAFRGEGIVSAIFKYTYGQSTVFSDPIVANLPACYDWFVTPKSILWCFCGHLQTCENFESRKLHIPSRGRTRQHSAFILFVSCQKQVYLAPCFPYFCGFSLLGFFFFLRFCFLKWYQA